MLVQYSLVDLRGIVLLDSFDCMTTKADLVAAEVENYTKDHCHCRGRGRLRSADDCYRLYGDHNGADRCRCQEQHLYAFFARLWLALHLGLHKMKLSALQSVWSSICSSYRHPCCGGDSDSPDRVYAGFENSLLAKGIFDRVRFQLDVGFVEQYLLCGLAISPKTRRALGFALK